MLISGNETQSLSLLIKGAGGHAVTGDIALAVRRTMVKDEPLPPSVVVIDDEVQLRRLLQNYS
jgi:hypothetical protein